MALTENRSTTVAVGDPRIAGLADRVRATYRAGTTRPLAWRRRQLQQLRRMLVEHEDEFLDALASDLGKPRTEGYLTDIAFVVTEIDDMLKHLEKWNRPEKVSSPMVTRPAKSWLQPEPLGVVLVIAPWNYPVQLLLVPVAGAIAAGNAVVMKPSEVSAATSAVIARLVPQYLDDSAIVCIEGAVPETTALLAQRWDHIFYTGNGTVGRVVARAAAEHLTPVTLELGGKSPAIVDASADVRVAARRIAWGKWLNAGQTCVAPDYVLVHRSVRDELLDQLQRAVRDFYGDDPQRSDSYGRIVSHRHLDRLRSLLTGGTVLFGGQFDDTERYLAPTVLVDVDVESPLMSEEIFGPLLPVLTIDSIGDAIAFVDRRDHPLALYVFAQDDGVVDEVLARTTAGGVTVNGTIVHLTNPELPFGGVGESGMGSYHGEASVRVFQHLKPVLARSTKVDPSIAYPPYTDRKAKLLRRFV
jgi:aldehyde dehydrogenase (NAD+)